MMKAPEMSRLGLSFALLGVALMLAAPAYAFQEVQTPPSQQKTVPGIALDFGAPSAPAQSRLGVKRESKGGILPRLDFGLDLLYQDQNVAAPPALSPQDQELGVMGTVRRRF